MAYDWTGNEVRQQRYDRMIVGGLLALLSITITAPFMVRLDAAPGRVQVETKLPPPLIDPPAIRLARS